MRKRRIELIPIEEAMPHANVYVLVYAGLRADIAMWSAKRLEWVDPNDNGSVFPWQPEKWAYIPDPQEPERISPA